MPHRLLNAREWLESLRLVSDCEFIPELLDLLDGEQDARDNADTLSDVFRVIPAELRDAEAWRKVEWIEERLALLEEAESIVSDNLAGMTWPNGRAPVGIDEQLEAAFNSDRWLDYDL